LHPGCAIAFTLQSARYLVQSARYLVVWPLNRHGRSPHVIRPATSSRMAGRQAFNRLFWRLCQSRRSAAAIGRARFASAIAAGALMFAIISDIHGNLSALETVLEDIKSRKITEIICLGDIIGYGPNPRECIELVQEHCQFAIMGNHDHAALYEPVNFNTPAERAAYWTRFMLENDPDDDARRKHLNFLGRLPVRMVRDDVLYVHASPRRPMNEYLFPEDVFTNPQKVMANFERLESKLCFTGHTHQPGIFLDDPYFDPPGELPDAPFYAIEEDRTIVNVGSVGQPRDRDPRASYVIAYRREEDDDDNNNEEQAVGTEGLLAAALSCSIKQLEFVRLEYDIERTAKEIFAIPELDNVLGERLFEGR
jgi:predicted phosphodiesterase